MGLLVQKDMDLRISEDPGRYLCDFIYYCSLSHLSQAGRPRKVCFLHVPSDASEAAVAHGRELTMNLVRSIAESETARGHDGHGRGQGQGQGQGHGSGGGSGGGGGGGGGSGHG